MNHEREVLRRVFAAVGAELERAADGVAHVVARCPRCREAVADCLCLAIQTQALEIECALARKRAADELAEAGQRSAALVPSETRIMSRPVAHVEPAVWPTDASAVDSPGRNVPGAPALAEVTNCPAPCAGKRGNFSGLTGLNSSQSSQPALFLSEAEHNAFPKGRW